MVRHWIASTNSVSWPDPTCQHPQLRKGILVPTNGGSPVPYMHRSVECQLFSAGRLLIGCSVTCRPLAVWREAAGRVRGPADARAPDGDVGSTREGLQL
jgi:hypothetical protein